MSQEIENTDSNPNNKLALVQASDLSLVEDNGLNANQLKLILKRTPAKYVHTRPAKGGGTWDYVTGGYIKKCLNLMFGWDWDFEIMSEQLLIEAKEVVVKGKLTCRSNGKTIVKMQYGNKDIAFRTEPDFNDDGSPKMIQKYGKTVQATKPSNIPLSIGNDMKAAATDCLKKCAAEIGLAADIYNKEDFNEIKVNTEEVVNDVELAYNELKALFELKQDFIPADQYDSIKAIIDNKQVKQYYLTKTFLEKIQTPE